MRRKRLGISKTVAALAVLAAALGCEADSSKSPSSQFASPVTPIPPQQVSIKSSRSTLTVGSDDVFAILTVTGLTAQFTPLPNGTEAVLTTNLGAFDSPGGGQTVTLQLFGGTAQTNFYPGGTEGSARVTATVNGITAQVVITIKPDPTGGVPPPPAPVESTLTLTANPSVLSEEEAESDSDPTEVVITATVLGSDGDPFQGAGVFFTTPLGTFSNNSATSGIFTTNGSGQIVESLFIEDDDLIAFPSGTFQVTGHLGVVGGERTAVVTITILAGPAPPVPAQVLLAASVSFVTEGTDPTEIDLDATVLDQNGDPIVGINVTFTSTLGNPNPAVAATAAGGIAESGLDLTQGNVDNHLSNSFTLTAKVTTSSGTVTSAPVIIAIVGADPAEPDSVQLVTSTSFVLDDAGGDDEEIDLTGTVFDQFLATFEGGQVAFSSSLPSGSFTVNPDTSDSNGLVTTTFSVNSADITAFPTNSFTITATLSTPDGPATDSVTITIVRPPVANFTFANDGVLNVIDFTDTSLGVPTTWAWDFTNDATIDSIVQNPTHDFTGDGGSGTYSVRLTVTNAVGSSTIVKSVPVPVP